MNILALQSGDWAIISIAILVLGSVIGGMVKFFQAIKILRKGPPQIDQEVLLEQQRENEEHEQND
jgi:hypothetical protein